MNYNIGAYNKNTNYNNILIGNFNVGKYNSGSSYNQQSPRNILPFTYDLIINQGVNYYKELVLKDKNGNPVNITGYTFTGSISPYENTAHIIKLDFLDVNKKSGKFGFSTNQTHILNKPRYVYNIDAEVNGTKFNVFRGHSLITNR